MEPLNSLTPLHTTEMVLPAAMADAVPKALRLSERGGYFAHQKDALWIPPESEQALCLQGSKWMNVQTRRLYWVWLLIGTASGLGSALLCLLLLTLTGRGS